MKYDIQCCNNLEYIHSLPDHSVQLVITSPNYNIGKPYEVVKPIDVYLGEQNAVLTALKPKLTSTASICYQIGNIVDHRVVYPLDILMYPMFCKQGLKLRNRIIWSFNQGLHCKYRFSGRYETIMWWTVSDKYIFNLDPVRVPQKYPGKKAFKGPNKGKLSSNPLGKNPGDIWHLPVVGHNHVEKTAHPCQFPVELSTRLVLALSDVGDTILDPYAGVATTLISACAQGRIALGCDTQAEYVQIALDRLRALEAGTLKIRGEGNAVY